MKFSDNQKMDKTIREKIKEIGFDTNVENDFYIWEQCFIAGRFDAVESLDKQDIEDLQQKIMMQRDIIVALKDKINRTQRNLI